MSRTTSSSVESLLGNNYDGASDLSRFIPTANLIVNRLETLDTSGVLSTEVKTEIESYLAAHFYTVADPLKKSESIGRSSASYNDRSYLEVAKALDFSGNLGYVMSGREATMDWLGLPPSGQTDYEDRD